MDDMSAASLSDEAAAELSRSLVEDLGGRDETGAYDDSLRVLRKAYLNALYTEHSRKANEYAQNGQHEACLQEYLSDCEDPDLKARLNGNSKYNTHSLPCNRFL